MFSVRASSVMILNTELIAKLRNLAQPSYSIVADCRV